MNTARKKNTVAMKDPNAAKAEELRLQGNDAYGTGDFERALGLYQESAKLKPQANTLSNTAAVLHKLGCYQEATQAAKQATEVNPNWAKGWWRWGLACELEKDFLSARMHYKKAAQLDKKNKEFRKYLDSIEKRLKGLEDADGCLAKETNTGPQTAMDLPTVKTFFRACELAREQQGFVNIYNLSSTYDQIQISTGAEFPTSEQYLFHGIALWITGLKSAIAELACCLDPQLMRYASDLKRRFNSTGVSFDEIQQAEQLLGGVPTGDATNDLISGFAHLGGRLIFSEMAPGRICPQPPGLRRYVAYQILAQLDCVRKAMDAIQETDFDFGTDMKCAPANVEAYTTFYANMEAPTNVDVTHKSKDCTPQEIVDYIKQEISNGRTWDNKDYHGGLRSYCAWQYRGTIMYASICRSMGQQYKRAYDFLRWARDFVELLDAEFDVTKDESYETYGNFFRPSLRVGIMMAELELHNFLGEDRMDGPYSIRDTIDLCLKVADMAKRTKPTTTATAYTRDQDNVAYTRKPLASAHSLIAHHLNDIRSNVPAQGFKEIALHHGFLTKDASEDFDPFALIAKHYRIAAENQLPDDDEGSILWWAYAGNFAQASQSPGRTLGELQNSIRTAQANEEARNVELFGPNLQKCGEYESLAKLVAAHFEDEPDSFVFPKVILDSQESTLTIDDGEIICDDFGQFKRNELLKQHEEERNARRKELMGTSELEEKFGPIGVETKPPSLATLAVRGLHKAGASYAKGESDGDVIIQKAMEEATLEEATREENPSA